MTDDANTKTVLVVEDNDLNLKLARSLIELNHHQVLEAGEAKTGLELARRHHPDLILMDINLPGMSGLDATRMIRKDHQLKKIPVLALTAYAMEEDKARVLEAGCNGHISKPISINEFQRIINDFLSDPCPVAMPEPQSHGHRILVVDDEALNRKLFAAKLSSKGYQISTAGDGETALQKVRSERPDLVLLDIMMPGIDGYEVTARLKKHPETRDIPIILVTALSGEDEKKKGLAAGADEFINKPVIFPELEARVISLLRLKSYQEQLGTRQRSEYLLVKGLPDTDSRVAQPNGLPSVLVVEDDSASAKLLIQYLSGMPCHIEIAKNGEDALRIATANKVDIMLLDIMLPGVDGFQVCRDIKGKEKTFPVQVVIITNLGDDESRIKGIEAGTDDFLVKPINENEFRARIKSLIKKKAYLDQLLARVDMALYAAITDELTGIYNHGYFKHFVDLEIKRSSRHRHALALLMIDVDDFKRFNDRYGHQCGDQALKVIAEILRSNTREIDLVARYGGEEFAVALPYTDAAMAEAAAGRLLKAVADHPEIPSVPDARLSVSIGISIFPGHIDSSEDLIRTADTALYAAKRKGKNQYCRYSGCDHIPNDHGS